MRIVAFDKLKQYQLDVVDLDTVPMRIRRDYHWRNENLLSGKTLCRNCDGTGNEFYASYRKCPDCDGTGVKPTSEEAP